MNLEMWTITKCGQGGEVKNPENFADVLYAWSLSLFHVSAVRCCSVLAAAGVICQPSWRAQTMFLLLGMN